MRIPLKLKLLLWYRDWFGKDELNEAPAIIREKNRKEWEKIAGWLDFPPLPMSAVTDTTFNSFDGHAVPVRVYRPSAEGNLPLIVYFHGGGFVLRDIDSHDRVCRRVAHVNQAVVVSVGYRLAPEWKFPVPVKDCYAATVWAAEKAKEWHADAGRLVVMGDSAGGNLATVVARMARDRRQPDIAAQVLIYPTTDARLCHPSIERFATGYFLTKEAMHWFVNHYKAQDSDILNPDMSPLLADDLSNMPPAWIGTAAFDPLKDEGKAYADKLRAAGNEVVYKDYDGMVHAFVNLPRVAPRALEAHEDIRQFLEGVWAK
ncbi:MAG: alpha/beta hydrolase [Bacteroidetes bacterium]|nr:MAG: alpha/beta hydrolase [Bacteroidota bacterium]